MKRALKLVVVTLYPTDGRDYQSGQDVSDIYGGRSLRDSHFAH